nr:PAS domain-containing sensor histidine kinase [uncultured Alsobacter sp.]
MTAFDWNETSLGPIAGWPQSLKTTVGLLLRSPIPIVLLWGADGVMIYNDPYSRFAGGRHPRLLGSRVREGWPEVADFNDNVMRVGLAGGTLSYKDQVLTLHRKGVPEQVWMNLDYSPVLDETGQPAGVLAIVVETTERVLAERHQRLLIDELNHRVKNTLATVQSIAAQTFKGDGALTPDAAGATRRVFDGRLVALSRAHDVLTRENWDGAGLHAIVDQAVQAYLGEAEHRFSIRGAPVRLTSKMALTIAMALHELCTNAVKYGALSKPDGRVSIAWEEVMSGQTRQLSLEWREMDGPPVAPPTRRGFGSRLIERQLAREFGGEVTLDFAPGGVVCRIVVPFLPGSTTPLESSPPSNGSKAGS